MPRAGNLSAAVLRIEAMSDASSNIAVVGAGMAGLACAAALNDAGLFHIALFDKSRGLSGRMSTRLSAYGGTAEEDVRAFDHGAQYFRARTARFAAWLAPFQQAGHVRPWPTREVRYEAASRVDVPADGDEKWVVAPGMNALGRAVLAGRPSIALHLDCGIDRLARAEDGWHLSCGEAAFGPFAHVVLAVPAPQAAVLLLDTVGFKAQLADVEMLGCHTLMLGYAADEMPEVDWDCARFDDDLLGFAAFHRGKPQRKLSMDLVVQTRHAWSQAHIEDDVSAVAEAVKARFAAVTGLPVVASVYDRMHRWRYASTATPVGRPYLHDAAQNISCIGDWCTGSKVEDAFLSATALADLLIETPPV